MDTFLRFKDLQAAGIVRNRTTLSRWIESQNFPTGRLFGNNTRAFSLREVENWLATRKARLTVEPPTLAAHPAATGATCAGTAPPLDLAAPSDPPTLIKRRRGRPRGVPVGEGAP